MANAPPSVDPSNEDSLQGVFDTVLRKFLQQTDDMLPARVISYDRDTNRAQVQPMVAMLTTAGEQVARAQIASVPVLLLGGGGHMLSFNLKPGDFGWVKANDRDISMFLQSWSGGPPNTRRMHTFEDALFIPDAMRSYTINGEDDEAVVLQTLDGNIRISLNDTRVKVTAGANDIEINETDISITAPTINLNGNIAQGGGGSAANVSITASASITITAPVVTINGRNFNTHQHTGVTVGAGNTGGIV